MWTIITDFHSLCILWFLKFNLDLKAALKNEKKKFAETLIKLEQSYSTFHGRVFIPRPHPPTCKSEHIKSVIRNSWKPFRLANTVTPVCVCQLLVMPAGTFKWAVIINDRGSTCACPFAASLSCVHRKLPADTKRTHKSEYSSHRVWSKTVKFVRLSTTKLQNLWRFSNYLLKPQGKREFLHSEKPSFLLSISRQAVITFLLNCSKNLLQGNYLQWVNSCHNIILMLSKGKCLVCRSIS